MKNNKQQGNDFEVETARYLRMLGFWVYRIPNKASGQPFDIIAVGNGKVMAVDCKVCKNDVFDKARIEENQHTAMKLFKRLNPKQDFFAGFAFKFADDTACFVEYDEIIKNINRTLGKKELLRVSR